MKNIFVLIIVAIILVLGVLLYDYIPTSKVVPTSIKYETPENLKAEIEDVVSEEEQGVILSYEVNAADLKEYQGLSSYVAGKINPFETYVDETEILVNGENNDQNNVATGDKNSNNTSDEEFFNNNKTK